MRSRREKLKAKLRDGDGDKITFPAPQSSGATPPARRRAAVEFPAVILALVGWTAATVPQRGPPISR